jgi:hypothetical protein
MSGGGIWVYSVSSTHKRSVQRGRGVPYLVHGRNERLADHKITSAHSTRWTRPPSSLSPRLSSCSTNHLMVVVLLKDYGGTVHGVMVRCAPCCWSVGGSSRKDRSTSSLHLFLFKRLVFFETLQ